MKYTRQQIIDEKYLIFIANEREFNTLKNNGFKLTGEYFGAYCYSEFNKSYSSKSTKTFKGGFQNQWYQDKILTINDIEFSRDIELPPRFPFKLTEDNFVKLVKAATKVCKKELCELFTPRIFTDTFVMIDEDYYNIMRKDYYKEGQKVLDDIFGADVTEKDIVTEKPFPKFMKSKLTNTIVLFSERGIGKVVKETGKFRLDYQSTSWDMDVFEDIEIEITEKN